MRKITYIAIILSFICFSFYIFEKERYFEVLEIYSPEKIGVDINKNNQVDENEIINVKVNLPTKLNGNEKFVYDYFSTEFSKNLLEHKKIKLKDNDIIFENQSYVKSFNNHDFSKLKGKNFKILNLKSNKYHNLDCKYGRQSSNYILLTPSQIPEDAMECNFCKHKKHKKKIEPQIQTFLDMGSIQFFATDLTTKLKPDDKCSTKLCKSISTQINNAKSSIDIALYGYGDIPTITKAFKNALNRGVNVRLVYDLDTKGENYYTDTKLLTSIIKISKADNTRRKTVSSLMHNKFIIIDRNTVITGSANISNTDMSGYNSNSAIIIKSQKIAEIYEKEFEQMYQGTFHTDKLSCSKPDKIVLGKSIVSVYFSPQDKPLTTKIIPLINSCKSSIYMPSFLITHQGLTEALIKAQKRGVAIKIILDATNASSKYSTHETLRRNGIKVKTENFAGKMHSKSIIIDEKYIIIGSMNFSKSGEDKNDENIIIIENPTLAKFYKNFFDGIWIKIPNKWLKFNVRAEGKNSIGSCSDGIDNDFDGKIDKEDEGCK